MAVALLSVIDESIVENFQEIIPPDFEWVTLYVAERIYQTKYYITYCGGPEGGYVYFYKERAAGWYKWHKDWFREPEYAKLEEGTVVAVIIKEDGSEQIGIVPENWEEEVEFDEGWTVIIGHDYTMQTRDTWNED